MARTLWIATLSLAGLAGSAGAIDDVITFDAITPGTPIDGVTLLGYATFDTQTQAIPSPIVLLEGTPDDGAFGSGAFLIGELGDFITIELAIPATRVSVAFTLDDTIHSSAQMHLQGFAADGSALAFEQGFPQATDTWPASMGDSVSGRVEIVSEDEMHSIGLSFAGTALATMFALDDIELTRSSCNGADLAAPFGVLDFSDVAAFLSLFSEQNPLGDLAPPTGQIDFGTWCRSWGSLGWVARSRERLVEKEIDREARRGGVGPFMRAR